MTIYPKYPDPVGDCPFCLANKKATVIAESPGAFAVIPHDNPVNGSFLVVPIVHIEHFEDLPDDWWRDVKEIFRQMKVRHPNLYWREQACNFTQNQYKPAGRTVDHLHNWYVPRENEHPETVAYHKGTAALVGLTRQASALWMFYPRTDTATRP